MLTIRCKRRKVNIFCQLLHETEKRHPTAKKQAMKWENKKKRKDNSVNCTCKGMCEYGLRSSLNMRSVLHVVRISFSVFVTDVSITRRSECYFFFAAKIRLVGSFRLLWQKHCYHLEIYLKNGISFARVTVNRTNVTVAQRFLYISNGFMLIFQRNSIKHSMRMHS